jgi:hypothetical protein
MFFAALKPDKTPLGAYPSMKAAQDAIAADEPDVLRQSQYQIHPIQSPADADALKLKVCVHWKLEKFDGEFAGQAPAEVLEGDF